MVPDLFPLLRDIRDSKGRFAVMNPEILRPELEKRDYEYAETAVIVMDEMRSHFQFTRTKPRLNELRNLASLISQYENLDYKIVMNILNDLNDCLFPDTIRSS